MTRAFRPPPAESSDPALDAAIDSFLDWAEHADVEEQTLDLPPPRWQELVPGAVLGDFELVRQIGAGGMGVVFEARQLSVSKRPVAVKVLRNVFASKKLEERFQREISAASCLDHPAIVPIVAAGVESGLPFYAMKIIDGISAADLVRELKLASRFPPGIDRVQRLLARRGRRSATRSASSSEPDSAWEESYPRWVARVAMSVAEALDHAHEHYILHRDVKPANIMITPAGRPVLLDFGLADLPEDVSLTRTGDFLGTLAYASPEQVRGDDVDAKTDVYSVGATLHELLTLTRPVEARNRSDLLRRLEEDAEPRLPDWVPADLRTICSCARARVPSRRYASAAAMAHDLREFLGGRPIRARPPGFVERAAGFVRRHPKRVVAAVVIPLLVLFAGITLRDRQRARSLSDEADRVVGEIERRRAQLATAVASMPSYADWRRAGSFPPLDAEHAQRLRELEEALADDLRRADGLYRQADGFARGFGRAHRGRARIAAIRLERALETFLDVTAPERFRDLARRLEEIDDGEHAALLNPRGSGRLDSAPAGARIEVTGPDGFVARGSTPLDLADPREGSYVARLAAPGHAPVTYPFLVRRRAAEGLAGTKLPRAHSIELLPEEEVGSGWVHVPAGWSLVQDVPPRWVHVESFLVRRHETTFEEWVHWMNRAAAAGEALDQMRPRDSYDTSLSRVAHEDGRWVRVEGVSPRAPVRGLARTNVEAFLAFENRHSSEAWGPRPAGWFYSLPTQAEWIRAARGADGRAHPWGDEFDPRLCVSSGKELEPFGFEIGAAPGDVSVFGVHDLAGSVSEATMNASGARGYFVFCGGSHLVADADAFRCTAIRTLRNEPEPDAGFRVVLRRVPEWCSAEPERPTSFVDTFDRPDSETVGNGWTELVNRPLAFRVDPDQLENGRIEGGRLRIDGGRGDHSEPSSVWRPVRSGPVGYTASLTMRATAKDPGARGYGLWLRPSLLHEEPQLALGIDFRGIPWLRVGSAFEVGETAFPAGLSWRLELLVVEGRVEARIWESSGDRPSEPLLYVDDLESVPQPRWFGIRAENLVGASIEVEEAAFEEL